MGRRHKRGRRCSILRRMRIVGVNDLADANVSVSKKITGSNVSVSVSNLSVSNVCVRVHFMEGTRTLKFYEINVIGLVRSTDV